MRNFILAAFVALLGVAPAQAQTACSQTLQSLIDAAPTGGVVLAPACTFHENLWIGKPVTVDGQNAAVITGDNTRDRWVQIYSSGVVIRNFTMQDAATTDQEGAICTCQPGQTGVVIDHNNLGPTLHGMPIGSGASVGTTITNNSVHGGGQLGIGSWQDQNVLIQGNHVFGNNTEGADPGWAAGGMKVMNGTARIIGNEVDHNNGPGIWIDIGETSAEIASNTVHDVGPFNPIFYEVSSGGNIHDNTVSGQSAGTLGWGCIISSTSGSTTIAHNACTNTQAILALYDNRPDIPADAGKGVQMLSNRFQNLVPDPNQANPTELTRWWQYTPTGPLIPGSNGNVDSGNMLLSAPTPTATPLPKATATAVPSPTVACQVEVFLNGISQGRKPC